MASIARRTGSRGRRRSGTLVGMPGEPTSRRRRLEGHVALVLVQLFFGLFPVFGQMAFTAFAPRAVAAWRIGVGALVLFAVAALLERRRVLVRVRDLWRFQVLAFLGVTANQVLFLEGLERSTAVNAGLIMCLIPVFTLVVAGLCGQETFRLARVLGIALALGGTVPLFVGRGGGFAGEHAAGNALMVANCFVYSLYLVASKPLVRRYPPLVVIAWVYVLALWQVPFLVGQTELAPAGAELRAWGSLGFVLLGPTVLGYLLNMVALARVDASTTAFYIYLQPLIAITGGLWILGETVPPGTRLAAALVFGGLALVTLPLGRRAVTPATPTSR